MRMAAGSSGAEEGTRSSQPLERTQESQPTCHGKQSFLVTENPTEWSSVYPCILEIMRKVLPSWEGMVFVCAERQMRSSSSPVQG